MINLALQITWFERESQNNDSGWSLSTRLATGTANEPTGTAISRTPLRLNGVPCVHGYGLQTADSHVTELDKMMQTTTMSGTVR